MVRSVDLCVHPYSFKPAVLAQTTRLSQRSMILDGQTAATGRR